MKSLSIFFFLALAITGCKKEEAKCRPYLEAVKDGTIPQKTTTVNLSDSLTYTLDYVREQDYKDYPHFCFGYKELNHINFKTALHTVAKKYSIDTTYGFYILSEGSDICNNGILNLNQVKYLLVDYFDKDNNAWFDFVDLTTGKTESHQNSGLASVSIYFLMKRTGIVNLPSMTEFRNEDFDRAKGKWLSRKYDPLFKLANP